MLLFRKNRVVKVVGPEGDLADADEKMRSKIMSLRILDLRENKLESIYMNEAANFLRETVILMWDNPFQDSQRATVEHCDPAHLFRAELEEEPIRNPLHIYQRLTD